MLKLKGNLHSHEDDGHIIKYFLSYYVIVSDYPILATFNTIFISNHLIAILNHSILFSLNDVVASFDFIACSFERILGSIDIVLISNYYVAITCYNITVSKDYRLVCWVIVLLALDGVARTGYYVVVSF